MLDQTGQHYSETRPAPIGRARRALLAPLLAATVLLSSTAFAADALEDLVTKANDAANRQDYPVAIQLYEQAVKKAPAEKTLKNNLAVLYANHGVNLQEAKKYDVAIQQFDKALALLEDGSPQRQNVIEAKAGTLYAEAMELRDAAQNDTSGTSKPNYARMQDLLERAMSIDPNPVAFRKGLAGVYLDEAYQYAVQDKFAEAMPLLEKGLTYDPQSKAIRQSLANVYLGLAKNDEAKRKEWVDKALATDDSPRIKQVADMLLSNKPDEAIAKGKGGFMMPGEAKAKAPKEISKLSVSEMIHDMEMQLKIEPPKNATLLARLEVLENQVLGKTQDGALATRTKTVYTQLMGSYDGTVANSNTALTQTSVASSENSYLDEIFKVTDGKVIRWGKFPVRVYIEEPAKDSAVHGLFKPEYKEAILHGFNAWKVKTNGVVNYVEIKNADTADIVVSFTDKYVDRFADPENVPTVYKNYSPPKKTRLMQALSVASMLTPGYYSLAPQALNAALQYKEVKKINAIREESKIQLGLEPTRELAPDAAKILIQNMAAKEFGHALGLKGSSPKEGDLLYPELRSDIAQLPSPRDLETLKDLYNRPPNIILNVR